VRQTFAILRFHPHSGRKKFLDFGIRLKYSACALKLFKPVRDVETLASLALHRRFTLIKFRYFMQPSPLYDQVFQESMNALPKAVPRADASIEKLLFGFGVSDLQ
jgi:hypothetical protein